MEDSEFRRGDNGGIERIVDKNEEKMQNIFRKIEKVGDVARRSLIVGFLGIASYATFSGIIIPDINEYTIKNSKEIFSENHLNVLLDSEKKEQGVRGKNIYACFNDTIPTSGCFKDSLGDYHINIAPHQRKVNVLKHEVRHIARGHLDRKNYRRSWKYDILHEPNATFYTLFHMDNKEE